MAPYVDRLVKAPTKGVDIIVELTESLRGRLARHFDHEPHGNYPRALCSHHRVSVVVKRFVHGRNEARLCTVALNIYLIRRLIEALNDSSDVDVKLTVVAAILSFIFHASHGEKAGVRWI